MDIKESAKFVARKILEKFRRQEDGETGDMNNQVLSPEFALAEMEYQVDELLFKMAALCGGTSLPSKNVPCYITDSDGTFGAGDDVFSTGDSATNEKSSVEEVVPLNRLLQLRQTGLDMKESLYSRSQLEMEVMKQLKLGHYKGYPIEQDIRPASEVGADGEYSCRPEPLIHSYHSDDDSADDSSFISIPDESYSPRSPLYSPRSQLTVKSPLKFTSTKDGSSGSKKGRQNQQEVFELEVHPRPISPKIAYHNTAFEGSDVELDIDIEFAPTTSSVSRLRKSKRTPPGYESPGSPRKNHSDHHNLAFQQENEPGSSWTKL